MPLKEKIVLITGGTGGLGRGVVQAFLNANATVIVTYTRDKSYPELKNSFSDTSRLKGIKADLTTENEVKALFRQIKTQYRRLDILVHLTGGFWMGGDVFETAADNWHKMMRLNADTTFLCAREAFALMKQQGGGKIFTTSAKTALSLPAGMGAYAVSKATVLALTEVLAREGKDHNIQVNSILPSVIDTPANRKSMPDADFSQWVRPEEIARVLLSLSSAEITAVSGAAIKIYGRA